jgi:hypothetical protein
MLDTQMDVHARYSERTYMYDIQDGRTCNILRHVRPSCLGILRVRPSEYLICMSVLSILRVCPFWVS